MSNLCKIVVLISGNGSNLQAILDCIQQKDLPAKICAVISTHQEAYGLVRANKKGIATHVIEHTCHPDRASFEEALRKVIDREKPDLIVLAGFMRILTPDFVRHYQGRLVNIHPSLLPKFPGLHTHQRALDARETHHGATVHFVTEEVDGGPIIIQGKIPILSDDTAETLKDRIHPLEHKIYPLAMEWFVEKRLLLQNGRVYLDGQLLPLSGFCYVDTPASRHPAA